MNTFFKKIYKNILMMNFNDYILKKYGVGSPLDQILDLCTWPYISIFYSLYVRFLYVGSTMAIRYERSSVIDSSNVLEAIKFPF